jgi:hypothetical protein
MTLKVINIIYLIIIFIFSKDYDVNDIKLKKMKKIFERDYDNIINSKIK